MSAALVALAGTGCEAPSRAPSAASIERARRTQMQSDAGMQPAQDMYQYGVIRTLSGDALDVESAVPEFVASACFPSPNGCATSTPDQFGNFFTGEVRHPHTWVRLGSYSQAFLNGHELVDTTVDFVVLHVVEEASLARVAQSLSVTYDPYATHALLHFPFAGWKLEGLTSEDNVAYLEAGHFVEGPRDIERPPGTVLLLALPPEDGVVEYSVDGGEVQQFSFPATPKGVVIGTVTDAETNR